MMYHVSTVHCKKGKYKTINILISFATVFRQLKHIISFGVPRQTVNILK